jgi:glutamate synthase (NADPH/NADH) small chain
LKDGVKFSFETEPIEYIGEDEKLRALRVRTSDGEKEMDADVVLVAIGSKPAKRIVSTTKGIEVDSRGYVITREKPYGMTTLNGVFAGGDVVHQPATVVRAMKEAKIVAEGISAYIDAKKLLGL